jgi:gentisate 1,2-dioxygenase
MNIQQSINQALFTAQVGAGIYKHEQESQKKPKTPQKTRARAKPNVDPLQAKTIQESGVFGPSINYEYSTDMSIDRASRSLADRIKAKRANMEGFRERKSMLLDASGKNIIVKEENK